MFDEAIADYRAVLKVSPSDPAAWNNLGNAEMGRENFEEAVKAFDKAAKLGGNNFAFSRANKAICMYVYNVFLSLATPDLSPTHPPPGMQVDATRRLSAR